MEEQSLGAAWLVLFGTLGTSAIAFLGSLVANATQHHYQMKRERSDRNLKRLEQLYWISPRSRIGWVNTIKERVSSAFVIEARRSARSKQPQSTSPIFIGTQVN